MNIALIIHVINFGLLLTLLGVTGVRYARAQKASLGYYTAGALLYAIFAASALFPERGLQGVYAQQGMEMLALFLFMMGYLRDEPRGFPRIAAWGGVIVLLFFNVILFLGRNDASPGPLLWMILAMQAVFLLYPGVMMFTRPRKGTHYLAQSVVFLLTAVVFTGLRAADVAIPPMGAIHALAYAFGFFSMILYMEASVAAEARIDTDEFARRALLFDISAQLIREFRELEAPDGGEGLFENGVARVARAVRDRLGYEQVFFAPAPPEGEAGPRTRYNDCFPGASVLAATIELSSVITDEAGIQRGPVLVEDAENDPRIRDGSLKNLGLNAFIVFPILIEGAPRGCLLAGSRRDGRSVGPDDQALFNTFTNHISLLFSNIFFRRELVVKTNTDPVTLLHNYSSFQMLLTESIQDADRNGRSFALVFIDMERFASVNEKCGYQRADQILRDVGATIVKHTGASEIGRVGADEFAYILNEGNEGLVRTEIERLLASLRLEAPRICSEVSLDFSVAFSCYPFDFMEQSGVFGKMREVLAVGSGAGRIVRVQCS